MSAGERLQGMLRERPKDPKTLALLERLEQKVAQDAENVVFDPKRYFYAQAYLDYFKRERFSRAMDDLEQVLVYDLENEEILEFMDKAQGRLEEEKARVGAAISAHLGEAQSLFQAGKLDEATRSCQKALTLDASNGQAKDWLKKIESRRLARVKKESRRRGKTAPIPPPTTPVAPDPEWVESEYREALKTYVRGDVASAVRRIADLLKQYPSNTRLARTIERLKQEDPGISGPRD